MMCKENVAVTGSVFLFLECPLRNSFTENSPQKKDGCDILYTYRYMHWKGRNQDA